jgi:hypothetical protein
LADKILAVGGNAGQRILGGGRMEALDFEAFGFQSKVERQTYNPPHFTPAGQELAEIKRQPSIEGLIARVHAYEGAVFSQAREREIDPLALRSRLLLHLPRLVTDELPSEPDIRQEILAVCGSLEESKRKYGRAYTQSLVPPERPIGLGDLQFGPLDADTARMYHESFHYIGSYRPGHHFAFRDKNSGKIVCIGSVGSFDLKHAEEMIAPHIDPRSVFVFSRFFAFRWAPKNAFSYFWGKLRRQMIEEHGAKLMFSFINPNVGFDARSHKAAQWVDFAHEESTRYMYLDGRYRTMRFFVENYGMSDPDKLKETLGNSFEVSTMDLRPMWILAIPLRRRARKVIPTKPYPFERPVL